MSLTTIQSTKQQTRHYLAVAADKMKIATASTMRGENKVGLSLRSVPLQIAQKPHNFKASSSGRTWLGFEDFPTAQTGLKGHQLRYPKQELPGLLVCSAAAHGGLRGI